MLILRVLVAEPLHGYAIAQRIHMLSREELSVEEGSLYPALQKLLLKGWVKASPAISQLELTLDDTPELTGNPSGGARGPLPKPV